MSQFQKKELVRTRTLGERLRKVREDAGISLEQAAKQIQIQKKYLEALERGVYGEIPGPIYVENFLKKYSEYLNVSADFVISLYREQDQKTLKKKYQNVFKPLPKKVEKELITPVLIKRVVIGVIILACLTYVGFEVSNIFSPPDLVVNTPQEGTLVKENTIRVAGHTAPQASLVINGREVLVDENGNFSESVSLQPGLNTIYISSAKEQSDEVKIIRNVFFEN